MMEKGEQGKSGGGGGGGGSKWAHHYKFINNAVTSYQM